MSGHAHPPNKKSQYIVLSMTFLLGFVTGGILFLYNNTGGAGDGSLDDTAKGFSVIARMYGGCADGGGCPSYRISEDGAYEYFSRNGGDGEKRFEESLPDSQLMILRNRIISSDFPAILQTKYMDECPANFNGTAYRYEITYQGVQYSLDSCVQDLGANMLFGSLQDYFEYFRITHGVV